MRRWGRGGLCAAAAAVALAGCRPAVEGAAAVAEAAHADALARGEYLATVGGCHDCHTPMTMGPNGPAPDLARALSGHPEEMVMPPAPAGIGDGPWLWAGAATNTAFYGPWGVSYASNLTPDEATGMGAWSEEMFVAAMRTGRHMGQSRPIQPPMPWPNLARATDEDLAALYAYLRSLPPIVNRVPDYEPPGGLADGDPFAGGGGEPAAG